MDIIQSEPNPMETISHMGMLGRKCVCNRTGRKINHGIIRTLVHEVIFHNRN